MTPPPLSTTDAERRLAWRQGWRAALVLILALWPIKVLAAAFPGGFVVLGQELGVGTLVFTLAAGFQLYFPLHQVGKDGVTDESLGLSAKGWRGEVVAFGVVAAVTAVAYSAAVHAYQTEIMGRTFGFRWPSNLLETLLVELLVVALAEELFFRGYVQERLTKGWPWGDGRRAVVGAVVLTSLLFACAHVSGEWRLARFGPFFPGLLFGALRARAGFIWSAVAYHAFCNLLADVLFASYR